MPLNAPVSVSVSVARGPAPRAASLEAQDLQAEIDGLLVGLRLDLAWLDRCLAEQAGSPGGSEEARHQRLQMRIRCDGMGDQLDRVAATFHRVVADMHAGAGRAPGPASDA